MAKKSKAPKKTPKNPRPRKAAALKDSVARPSTAMETFDLGGPQKRKKTGVKAQVAALLMAGGAITLEELLKETNAKEVTLRTALSDLRSSKYAGPTGALAIELEGGKYQLKREVRP